jgi:RNA polymerase sigma factor (sigma-70 family)
LSSLLLRSFVVHPFFSNPALNSESSSTPTDIFATTHWTVVLTARQGAQPEAQSALEELCRTYWFPLYAYVRQRGHSKEDAEDLTQAFFERFLEKNFLGGMNREQRKFRAFMLTALKHFLANEWDKSQRQKRGSGAAHLSLDWQTADTQFQIAATEASSPDRIFDREWALALLRKVITQLEAECASSGRGTQFEHLKIFLTAGKGAASYADVARDLGLEETAVRVAVHRLRKRCRQLLRAEIANTLSDPAQVDEELRTLFGAMA